MPRSALHWLILLTLLAGCDARSVSQRLAGEWVGRPDTAAAKLQRNPIAGARSPGSASPAEVADAPPDESGAETDLERFDFQIRAEFAPTGALTLDSAGERRRGTWRILSTDAGLSVLETRVEPPEADPQAGAETRRYQLVMEPQDGFTLREEGADPRFGWLYFQRAE